MFFSIFLLIVFSVINQTNGSRFLSASLHGNCTIEHESRLLNEGEKITIKGKLFKVEECHLQRAYQTCGYHLWYMINVVCEAIETQKQKNGRGHHRFRKFA